MSDIMNNIQRNPIGLAGLMVMQGMRMKDALPKATLMVAQNAEAERSQAETNQNQYLQANADKFMGMIDGSDPNGSMMKLLQLGVPYDTAQKMVKFKADALEEVQKRRMMENLLGIPSTDGGGAQATGAPPVSAAPSSPTPDPNKLMQAGVLTGNPALVQYGTALMSQGNRVQDVERDAGKTNEQYYAELDKRYADRIEPLTGVIDDYNVALDLAKEDNGSADYNLIKMGVQAFDKRNSAVTDDEFRNMQQTGNINERLRQVIGKYSVGDTLTAEQRKQIISAIRQRAEQNRGKIDKINDAFSKKASGLGIDFENIRSGYDPGDLRSMDDVFGQPSMQMVPAYDPQGAPIMVPMSDLPDLIKDGGRQR